MSSRQKFLIWIWFAIFLLFTSASPIAAAGNIDGKVIFGNSFTLKSGETMNGDLVVMGGVVVVEEGATVNGSVVLIGGTLTIDGEVTGDATLIGGTAALGNTAHVRGNLVTIGGSLQKGEDARIDGEVITNIPAPEIEIPSAPLHPEMPQPPAAPRFASGVLGNVATAAGRILVITLLAVLAMLFLQQPAERIGYAIVRQPFITGGVGLLTVFISPLAIILLAVTIILSPVALLAVLALILAWLLGIIAIGLEVGQRFTTAINRQWPAVATAGFGTFLTMTALELIGIIPCLGMLIAMLIGLMGIGGAVITVFGSRPYPPAPAAPPSAMTSPLDGPAG